MRKKVPAQKRPPCKWTPETWNARYPVGTPVRVTVTAADLGYPAVTFDSVTRNVCWALGDGTPVVLVEGRTGGWSVEPGWMLVLDGPKPVLDGPQPTA